MNRTARYILLVLGVIISLHYILTFTHREYSRATLSSTIVSRLRGQPSSNQYEVPERCQPASTLNSSQLSTTTRRANATFVILARNSDLDGTLRSIRDIEDRFNRRYGYPYVFLNEVPFAAEFKKRISNIVSSKAEFGVIPHDHWFQPNWIDEEKAAASRRKMEDEHIIYGGSVSYRNMCRFNAGFFFKHELLQKYRYYWRIEPDIHYHCYIDYDPILFMQDTNKIYGFTITMYEFEKTIATLWATVKDFMKLHPEYIKNDNAMDFMSANGGESYNLCHFWSNFEIADMDFWRGPAYTEFFQFLDSKGGFYYERWGDAPVHSIAAGILARKDQIHFFDEIGYEHGPYTHCPKGENWSKGKCGCDQTRNFDYDGYSCLSKWEKVMR